MWEVRYVIHTFRDCELRDQGIEPGLEKSLNSSIPKFLNLIPRSQISHPAWFYFEFTRVPFPAFRLAN